MHYKRRKRRKAGVKGCCTMCAMRTRRGGLRNQRLPSIQERRAPKVSDDWSGETDLVSYALDLAR